MSIKPIDKTSIHRITSGQVVIDLQTAVKELVENSLDAGATNLEVRFRQYGLSTIEVIDNGCGISEENYEGLALKNHTSKLSSFEDLSTVTTFGFRGEALSSLCALCDSVVVSTAVQPPMGVSLEMESSGKIAHKGKVARQRGTTITLTKLFSTLPVRRKEFERNAKREFGKALTLLNAYALGPCSSRAGVRLTVSNQLDKGQKSVQIRTPGIPSLRASVSSLWGPKALDNIVDLDLSFVVERDKIAMKRAPDSDDGAIAVVVRGLVSKFAIACGRTGTDRQFFFVNGRPCSLSKVQKAFNEVYRSFNAMQSPFIIADLIIPTDSCDINVSPDKRSIFLHHETNLISALKTTLETSFASSRSTFDVESNQLKPMMQTVISATQSPSQRVSLGFRVEREEITTTAGASDPDVEMRPITPPPVANDSASSVPVKSTTSSSQPSSASPRALASVELSASSPAVLRQIPAVEDQAEQAGSSPFLLPVKVKIGQKRDSRTAGIDNEPPPVATSILNITPPAAPPSRPSRSSSDDVVVALDSPPASWRRKSACQLSDEPAEIPAPPNSIFSRKKRRSEPDDDDRPQVLHGSSVKVASARRTLRTMLVGFSRNGAQAADEEDELEGESSEEEDGGMSSSSPAADLAGAQAHDRDVTMDVDVHPRTALDLQADTSNPPIDGDENGLSEDEDEEGNIAVQIDPDAEAVALLGDNAPGDGAGAVIDLTDDDMFDSSDVGLTLISTTISVAPSTDEVVSRPEVIRQLDNGSGDASLRFDLSKISASWHRLRESLATACAHAQSGQSPIKVPLDAGIANMTDDDTATEALARTIDKTDFNSMEVVGQFNLGFIVARRQKAASGGASDLEVMDDLFIIDQHAADEKYNFETLQQTTHIKSQKLFRAQPLELTAGDELLALENIDVLRQNGFEILLQAENNVDDGVSGHSRQLLLTAQPVSKGTVFDMKDLEELIHLMHDQPSGQVVRCSKARAMFAMRACRKSVMVGMPLTKGQMTSVIRHMGTMDQPWNCPHGRPTMRHLTDIRGGERRETIDWSAY